MAKRFQPMKEFGRTMKKPKLDISINSRGTSNKTSAAELQYPSTSKGSSISPLKCSQNNFWDDDDDDVILLATQVAEAAVAKQEYNNITITETDITFSEFGNAATTSTQNPLVTKELPGQDILSQMFEEDDDDLLAAVEKEDPGVFKKPLTPPATLKPSQNFAKSKVIEPKSVVNSTQKITQKNSESEDFLEFRLTQNTGGADSTMMSSQSAARRQLASERQIKFLMEKVDTLKKENSKLSNDLTESKSKIESKEGEVSLLRDELRHIKQQAQNLRMEKIFSTEAAKGECQSKIAELAKKVEAQQTEIRLKEAQTSRMKMKQADETQRLQHSLSMVQVKRVGENVEDSKQQRKLKRCLMKMQCLDLNSTYTPMVKPTDLYPQVFDTSLDRGGSAKRKTLFECELETIQTLLAQLQLLAVHEIPESFIAKCIDSACKVLPEFWSYTHTLYFLKYCETHPYHNYALSDSKIYSTRLLQQPTEIYESERCLCFRRYIAILAIMCQREPSLALGLLQYKHGEYYLLQIATDAIITLGFACGICEHFGVLEAFSIWLKSMLQHISQDTNSVYLELLVDLMKHIVFTRPCAWIFREISICLWECCRLPDILDMLCINSPEKTFVADRVKSTYRFSNESCFMQVYCGLLEISFPLSSRLHLEHFKLLVDICLNHVRFTYHCFIQPPKFIHKMLPIYDDDEDEDDANGDKVQGSEDDSRSMSHDGFETTEQNSTAKSVISASSTTAQQGVVSATVAPDASSSTSVGSNNNNVVTTTTRCECYIKQCLSVVTLIFQLMRQWFFHKMEYCTDEVAEISRLSVQLLHMIFCDYYLTCLFRESEATTKYYLSLILKWWSDNAKKLNFNEIDLKFLQKIQNSHVIPKDIAEETNLNTIIADLSEWQTSTKDDVRNIKPSNANEAQEIADRLELIESASKAEKFFEVFKGYAFNFQ